jgi:hypothetical protein
MRTDALDVNFAMFPVEGRFMSSMEINVKLLSKGRITVWSDAQHAQPYVPQRPSIFQEENSSGKLSGSIKFSEKSAKRQKKSERRPR